MKAEFYYDKRRYTCIFSQEDSLKELRIRNYQGLVLAVKQGQTIGLLGKKREDAIEVNVSQPRFYNLIKAATNALKLEEINQIILDKDQLIKNTEQIIKKKDQQLEIIKQKLTLLKKQLGQLSVEQQERLEALELENQKLEEKIRTEKEHNKVLKIELDKSIPQLNPEQVKTEIRNRIGSSAWNRLAPSSRSELCFSYQQFRLINSESFTAQITDYSFAGLGLCLVAEREIINIFFTDFYRFLCTEPSKANLIADKTFQVGGIILKPKGKYTLGNLPSLLSVQWKAFKPDGLEQENHSLNAQLYHTVFFGNKVSDNDRKLVAQFLQQWQHPLSKWLAKGEAAASVVDQIRQLRNRVPHPEHVLYKWQFQRLQAIMLGGMTEPGILKEIYDT